MVRRISTCSACKRRVVAIAGLAECSNCSQERPSARSFHTTDEEPAAKRIKAVEDNRLRQPSNNQLVIDLCEQDSSIMLEASLPGAVEVCMDEDEASDDAGSEHGDDFHCTQIMEVENANQQEVTNEPTLSNERRDLTTENMLPPQAVTPISNNDICFICGTNLTGLKRRVDHIKRCSKKHSVTGRDVTFDDDLNTFLASSSSSPTKVQSSNPYSRPSSWHGNSSIELGLADSNPCTDSSAPTDAPMKQSTLASFLQAPIQNVNKVLIAGARRLAKTAEVFAASKNKPPATARKSGRRRSFPQRDYSKVSNCEISQPSSSLYSNHNKK